MKNIQVMVIDDSAVVRQALSNIINSADGMEVVAVAIDPIFAMKKLQKIKPDVITLDIEMPRMDGLTFLEQLMQENPIPVVMCSKLTQQSAPASLRALQLGAVEIVAKPCVNLKHELARQNHEIVNAVRVAAAVNPDNLRAPTEGRPANLVVPEKLPTDAVLAKYAPVRNMASSRLVAIGASTGGTQALEFILAQLDADSTGVVVVQHMPEAFTGAFAQRLDRVSPMEVREARDGDRVNDGLVLIAPGGQHMIVENHGGELYVAIRPGPQVNRHCPSVNVLFRSVAQAAPRETLGIILTGMGDDGAHGMKELFDAGAFTVAQDEASCVIFGMPGRALEQGGVTTTSSLEGMPVLINAFRRPRLFRSLMTAGAEVAGTKALARAADS